MDTAAQNGFSGQLWTLQHAIRSGWPSCGDSSPPALTVAFRCLPVALQLQPSPSVCLPPKDTFMSHAVMSFSQFIGRDKPGKDRVFLTVLPTNRFSAVRHL